MHTQVMDTDMKFKTTKIDKASNQASKVWNVSEARGGGSYPLIIGSETIRHPYGKNKIDPYLTAGLQIHSR